jgi:DNA-binding transcriptional LysR family regulator
MDEVVETLDWALIRAVLAVAEAGSLSGAARRLGLSQPTLGRQVRAAEVALGVSLFARAPRGLVPTEAGAALIPHARAMAEAAARLTRAAEGRQEGLAGTVRITASVHVSHFVLPGMLARLRAEEPGIEVELVATDAIGNLLFREADIAVRMVRPEQQAVVTRHVADLAMGLYAARSYAERRGLPEAPGDLRGHDLVGFDRDDLFIRTAAAMGFAFGRHDFAVRCDMQSVYWQLVRAGCGIGGGMDAVAARDPGLVRVLPDVALPPLPVWLATHEALRGQPRVRRVMDHLAAGLAAFAGT